MKNATDDIRAYTQAYYMKNRMKWKQYYNNRVKVTCPICLQDYRWLDTHLTSKKHLYQVELTKARELVKDVLATFPDPFDDTIVDGEDEKKEE